MGNLIQPVILRFLTYVLSSLALMLPAWAAGLVVIDPAQGLVSLSLATACSLIAGAIVANLTVAARWGVKVDPAQVSGLLLRLATYGAAPAIAALPSSWAGVVAFNPTTSMLSLSYGALAGIGAAAIGGSAAVFAKWGAKP
jgi:hypothetical protein